jgi:hypothetical protein
MMMMMMMMMTWNTSSHRYCPIKIRMSGIPRHTNYANFTVINHTLLQLHRLLEYGMDHAPQAIWQCVLTNNERYKNLSHTKGRA